MRRLGEPWLPNRHCQRALSCMTVGEIQKIQQLVMLMILFQLGEEI